MKVRLSMLTLSCATLLFMAGLGFPVWSQEFEELETIELSLDETLRIALENNLELVSLRFGPLLAEQDVETQASNFDLGFQSQYTRQESERAATQLSTVTGSEVDAMDAAGIQQNLKFGADYTVNFNMTKFLQTGPNVVAPTSYDSRIDLVFNLPILKGFGTEPTTELLVLARNDLEISLSDLEGQAERIMQTVEGAYWDVVAARAELRIARLALERAQDLLDLNRKKVEVGTLAPIEITQAEAGVASNEEGVILAEVALRDAEDELRRLMAVPDDDLMWDKAIMNTTPPDFEPRSVDLPSAIETALASRAEMFSSKQTLRNRELSERVAKRQKRHQLDLATTYSPTGTSLDEIDPNDPFGPLVGAADLGDSISNIFDSTQDNWSARLTYRVPIGNRAAKADYARARYLRERAETDLQDQEQTIRVEVRRAARAVVSGVKRVEAARTNVRLQQEKLDAEQKKFDNGMSTSFEVLTFQNDLADAEKSEIQARLDYIKSLAALEVAKGTMLESRNLELARPPGDDGE